MAITVSEARRSLIRLIEKVNDDRAPIEIISKRGNAVLMSADDHAAWQETAYFPLPCQRPVGCVMPPTPPTAASLSNIHSIASEAGLQAGYTAVAGS